MQYMNTIFVCNEEFKGACNAIHLATNLSSNCSRSDVNVRAQLLRKNYSRILSSIRSGPKSSSVGCSKRVHRMVL